MSQTLCPRLFLLSVLLWNVGLSQAQSPRPVQTVTELTAAILGAASAADRAALLDAATAAGTVTEDLRQAVVARGDELAKGRKWEAAIVAYQAAQEIAARLNDKAGVAFALSKIGIAYFSMGRFPQARDHHQQSLKLRKELGDRGAILNSLFNIALTHRAQSDSRAALDYLQQCYSMLGEVKSTDTAGRVLNSLGLVHKDMGNYLASLSYYQQALSLFQSSEDRTSLAGTQQNVGNLYQMMGEYDTALGHLHQSLALSREIDNKSIMSGALNGIGNVYKMTGNLRRAMEFYQRSLQLKQELGDQNAVASTYSNIGDIHELQGNYPQALDLYQRSAAIRESLGQKAALSALYGNIGDVHRDMGEPEKALENFRKSLLISEKLGQEQLIAASLRRLGSFYHARGDKAQAIEHLQKSLELSRKSGNKRGLSSSLADLSLFYVSEGMPLEALRLAEQAVDVSSQTADPELIWQTLGYLGTAYQLNNRTADARRAFEASIRTIETLRGQAAGGEIEQQNFFARKAFSYHGMIELLAGQNDKVAALRYAERLKGRLLLDVLQSGHVNITKTMTDEEKRQERVLRNEMVSLNAQLYQENLQPQSDAARLSELNESLRKARLRQQEFRNQLYASRPNLSFQRGETGEFTLDHAAALLPDDKTALLEYAVTQDKVFLFVLTRNTHAASARVRNPPPDIKVYQLAATRKELNRLAQSYRALLAGHDLVFKDAGARLYNLLLQPARADLQGKSKLVIIPDGSLWELPFQALPAPNGRYLIEDHTIFYAPSLAVLAAMTKKREQEKKAEDGPLLLALGNPSLGKESLASERYGTRGDKLTPLPEAEAEVKKLSRLYGESRSKVYVGAAAREDQLRAEAGKYRILHLATHGLLDDTSPMFSQLVMSQEGLPETEDGLLEAWEILELDLNAELVVLSACETARGRVHEGEGLIGLTWALFVAGSPATLVSQWKVGSASTTDLMLDFHLNLRPAARRAQPAVSKATALRAAMLKMLRTRQYNHPFYWAPFVIVGDGF
ncbi:MAG TPA: CHAT domain-containing tetratricopeptide repeat protein [Pyrinomonadaceae bacterium]|nr:CHAT domain-containing tetratricopeptide repeat protein [Pyrinomonadaceae bacterium]